MKFSQEFLQSTIGSILRIDCQEIDNIVDILVNVRNYNGRVFIIGSGGSSGNASHAVCDFRKLCDIETYNPYDNSVELTARTNDDGYATTIVNWLKVSRFNQKDCLFVLSVGGGWEDVSTNIVKALDYAEFVDAKIVGIVGKSGGMTKQMADACILIETKEHITPITEGLQSVVLHLIVSHPSLQISKPVW